MSFALVGVQTLVCGLLMRTVQTVPRTPAYGNQPVYRRLFQGVLERNRRYMRHVEYRLWLHAPGPVVERPIMQHDAYENQTYWRVFVSTGRCQNSI